MIVNDFDKAMAVISILETMENDELFLSTICMAIDHFNCRTKMPINEILKRINTVVPEVNEALGPVTEKIQAKVTFKNGENTND